MGASRKVFALQKFCSTPCVSETKNWTGKKFISLKLIIARSGELYHNIKPFKSDAYRENTSTNDTLRNIFLLNEWTEWTDWTNISD